MGLGVCDTKAYRGKERRELRVHFFNRFFRGDRVKITFENGHIEYGHFHEIVNERDFHGGRFQDRRNERPVHPERFGIKFNNNSRKRMTEITLRQRRSNTRHLKRLIRAGRIVVRTDAGTIEWPNGKNIATHENGTGYLRFKIRSPRCRWFFVHKAVFLASGKQYRHDRQIDHIDNNVKNNSASNLMLLTPASNTRKARERLKDDMDKHFPPAF